MFLYKPIGSRVRPTFGASPQTVTVPVNANGVLIQAITQNVRISFDVAAPAGTTDGIQIRAGDPVQLIPLATGESFTVQQETSGAAFYVQPVYWWTPVNG